MCSGRSWAVVTRESCASVESLVGLACLCQKFSSLSCRYDVVHVNLSITEVVVWCVVDLFDRRNFMAIAV